MTSSLIGDVSSHCLGRSSGRPFVYGPSLACPQRVSQVSMGTMVCFLANASINPQTGWGNLGPGEWSEAYQIGLRPCLLCQAGFSLLATAAGREPATSASKADALSIELRGQPWEPFTTSAPSPPKWGRRTPS